jgi:hypothetical protein
MIQISLGQPDLAERLMITSALERNINGRRFDGSSANINGCEE